MRKTQISTFLVCLVLVVLAGCAAPAAPAGPAAAPTSAAPAQPAAATQPPAAPTTALAQPTTAPAAGATTAPEAAAARGSVKMGDWNSPAPGKLPASVNLGAVFGMTGDIAVYGEPQKKGLQLAVDQINSSGYLGKTKLNAMVENSTGSNEGAIAAMTKVIDDDKAFGVVGPTLSAQAFAADPIAQEKGIPVIGPSNTAAGIVEMGDFIFRDSLPESAVIPGTIKGVMTLLPVKKVGLLWGNNDDFTAGGYKVFKPTLEDQKIEILDEETFARGDVDFQAQLTKIIAQKPDAIVVSALAKEAALIVTQARSQGFTGPIVGGNGFNSPAVIKQAGPAAEGVIVGAAWNIASPEPLSADFIQAYQAAYGGPPDQFAAQAYTAAWLMATALRRAASVDPKAVRDALGGIKDFGTPLGSFSFAPDRNPVHAPVVQIVRNGKFVVLTPETAKP